MAARRKMSVNFDIGPLHCKYRVVDLCCFGAVRFVMVCLHPHCHCHKWYNLLTYGDPSGNRRLSLQDKKSFISPPPHKCNSIIGRQTCIGGGLVFWGYRDPGGFEIPRQTEEVLGSRESTSRFWDCWGLWYISKRTTATHANKVRRWQRRIWQ